MVTGSARSIMNVLYNLYHRISYSFFSLMSDCVAVGGLHVGVLMQDPDNYEVAARHMEFLIQLYADGKISPVIDSVWPFEKVCNTIERLLELN